jgi:hypothetical protein
MSKIIKTRSQEITLSKTCAGVSLNIKRKDGRHQSVHIFDEAIPEIVDELNHMMVKKSAQQAVAGDAKSEVVNQKTGA